MCEKNKPKYGDIVWTTIFITQLFLCSFSSVLATFGLKKKLNKFARFSLYPLLYLITLLCYYFCTLQLLLLTGWQVPSMQSTKKILPSYKQEKDSSKLWCHNLGMQMQCWYCIYTIRILFASMIYIVGEIPETFSGRWSILCCFLSCIFIAG